MPRTVRDLLSGIVGEDTLRRKLQTAYERLILECRREKRRSLPLQLMELESLIKQTGVAPDLPVRFVQDAYKAYVKSGIPEGVPVLSRLTGFTPELPEQDVQKAYHTYLLEGWVDSLKILHEQTGIEFAFPEHLVQKAYLQYLQKDMLTELAALHEMIHTKPQLPENLVHAAYARLLSREVNKWPLQNLKLLQDATGISPHTSMVQDAYGRALQELRLWAVMELQESTGIKPDMPKLEEYVQAIYAKDIGDAFCHRDYPNSLSRLADIAGIKPSGAAVERSVQEAYTQLFDWVARDVAPEEMAQRMVQLHDFTGIRASLPRHIIDAAFRKDPYRRSIHAFSKVTGMPMTDAFFQNGVQDAYNDFLRQAENDKSEFSLYLERSHIFEEFYQLYESTGIEPSKKVVGNVLQFIVRG